MGKCQPYFTYIFTMLSTLLLSHFPFHLENYIMVYFYACEYVGIRLLPLSILPSFCLTIVMFNMIL